MTAAKHMAFLRAIKTTIINHSSTIFFGKTRLRSFGTRWVTIRPLEGSTSHLQSLSIHSLYIIQRGGWKRLRRGWATERPTSFHTLTDSTRLTL